MAKLHFTFCVSHVNEPNGFKIKYDNDIVYKIPTQLMPADFG